MSYQYFFSSRVNCTTFFFGYLKAMFWRMINTRLLRRWRYVWSKLCEIVVLATDHFYRIDNHWQLLPTLCEIANYTLENYNSEFC